MSTVAQIIQCNGFTVEISVSSSTYDDGRSSCPTCNYPEEYEFDTEFRVDTDNGGVYEFRLNEIRSNCRFYSVAEITRFMIDAVVEQLTFEEFKDRLHEVFDEGVVVIEKEH